MLKARAVLNSPQQVIEHLLTDSRKLVFPSTSLFFALPTSRKLGSDFINELYLKGVKSFVVSANFSSKDYPQANFILVENPVKALQQLATYHRKRFTYPVIGVTGSNGKTVVKEWLYQMLQSDYNIVRSPKSYNSQIGVPLSVWQMNEQNNLAIIEAGISQPGEMQLVEEVVRPTIGVITNIGEAHSSGFTSVDEKAGEKFILFKHADFIIYNSDNAIINEQAHQLTATKFSWGKSQSTLQILSIEKLNAQTIITAFYRDDQIKVVIPFTDEASIENAITCWCVLLHLQVKNSIIAERMLLLKSVEMRLQLKKAINNCLIINDSYSNDLSSLNIALDFLQQHSGNLPTTVILSDIAESTGDLTELYTKVADAIKHHHVNRFIGIGEQMRKHQHLFDLDKSSFFFDTAAEFKQHFSLSRFKDELILLKGARTFAFEQIDLLFAHRIHQTVLEVNLSAMVHNLKEYQRYIKPSTKIMAMVKAFSYGSGSVEIANVLQYYKVDYLAVAYADEGVELRKAGIRMPILVLNPEEVTFAALIEYSLEPEIYSFSILHALCTYLDQQGIQQFPVHLKVDTGMHRLGFDPGEIDQLITDLNTNKKLVVLSIFSHLVASNDPQHDAFTLHQSDLLNQAWLSLQQGLGYSFMKHISNSSAIFRHPELQYDMVRLGIGLYGIHAAEETTLSLQKVATLKSTVAQVKKVAAGESVGYNRQGIVEEDSLIATVRIGYADGFSRKLGNGVGSMFINGRFAPVIGNVCMDMTMLNVSGMQVKEGDEVEIFGPNLPVQQLATWCNTIPYEIITGISQRVRRIYFEE